MCAASAFSLSSGDKDNPSEGHYPAADFSVSIGGRIFYNGMFNIWKYNYEYTGYADPNADLAAIFDNNLFSNHGFGIGGFFDATYVEIGIDFIFGSFKPNSEKYFSDFELKSTQFGFSILGKYPFAFGEITVFPLLGIDYQLFLSGESNGWPLSRDDLGDDDDMYDAFSISVGIGLDYNLSGKLYLRGELLANFKKDSTFESELIRLAEERSITFSLFTFGPRVSIGLGYKL
jgi:hypothetical protein